MKNKDKNLPASLFRYRSSKRIVEELRSMKMRFSKISSFNDPFDVQLLSKHNFSEEEFFKVFRLESEKALKENSLVKPLNDENLIHNLLWHFNQMQEPKILQADFLDSLILILKEKGISLGPGDVERGLISGLSNILRCICFSRSNQSLLMWAHYGEEHRGAVVEFRIPSESAVLINPIEIKYSQAIPDSGEILDFVLPILGFLQSKQNSTERLLYTKSIDWSYEEEWRVFSTVKSGISDDGLCSFADNDVIGVYFGCRMDISVRRELLEVIEQKYPRAKVFQGQKNERSYSLDFSPIRMPGQSLVENDSQFPDQLLELYSQCVKMFYRGLNDPLGARETWEVDCLKIDAALTLPVQREIRMAFRTMLDSADSYACQRRQQRADIIHRPANQNEIEIEIEKRKQLRSAALPYRNFHELADAHLQEFERQLKPI